MFQVLSLSGGGFLGLYTITVLEELEQKAGRPIIGCFDLIAGTSIGGIIALGLASGKSAESIRKAFQKNGEKIFSERSAPIGKIAKKVDLARSALKPKYDGIALKETIASIVGENTLIGDLLCPTIIPAINLTKGSIQFFKTPHHQDFKNDLKLKVVDVALATSAAPTYFPLAEIESQLYADGGLFANAPDLAALHEAEHFFAQRSEKINLLSIGTTTSNFSFSHTAGKELGFLGWLDDQKLMRTSMSAQQLYTQFMLQHRLGERYLRIDTVQSALQERDLALDVATKNAQKTIIGLGKAEFQRNINNKLLEEILKYSAAKPTFHNHPKN